MRAFAKASFAMACLALAAADAFASGWLPEPFIPFEAVAVAAVASLAGGAVVAALSIRRSRIA